MPPTIRQPGAGRTVSILGHVARFLVTGEETSGRYAMFENTVEAGDGGPPPHTHRNEEESFYVLEGTLTFLADGKAITAGPGTFVNVPAGVPHTFRNDSGKRARALITLAPAGLERMFLGYCKPLPDGATTAPPPTPEEIDRLIKAAPSFGIEFVKPG